MEFMKCEKNELKMLIIDHPRSGGRFNYGAVESISNGYFFSGKYESGMCVFNPPHIVVFSNMPPDKNNEEISKDRIIEYYAEKEY